LAIWLKNGDPAPGGGVFQGPWSVALNDRGELAFLARVALPKGKLAGGWFFGVPGRWQKLLGWDDVVEKGKVIDLTPSRGATRPFDESRRLLASARVQRPDGTQSVQTLLSEPGRTRVLVREDQESPWGGLYGEVNPSSLRGCFGVVGVGQPDSSYPSAQMGFQLRRCGGRTGR